jgi:hypothetical protein
MLVIMEGFGNGIELKDLLIKSSRLLHINHINGEVVEMGLWGLISALGTYVLQRTHH